MPIAPTTSNVSILAPGGVAIAPLAINALSSTMYAVTFPKVSASGRYTVTVGPQITDVAGNLMDQNRNGINGEVLGDNYTATFTIAPLDLAYSVKWSGPLNTPGTIDADYRGEIKIILINLSNESQIIHPGDRVAQMVIQKVEKVSWKTTEVLEETGRSAGGFGHTGKH